MDILPILSTLRRHKTAATLIVLQIALTCAIICNALFLIGNRLDRMNHPSGLAEDEVVRVQITGIGRDANAKALTAEDLAALRAIPGVKAATVVNQVPFGNSSWNSGVRLQQEQTHATLTATTYLAEEQFLQTLGLRLAAGRNFTPDEYVDWPDSGSFSEVPTPSAAIITRALTERLFPGENAVGKTFYAWGDDDDPPHRVVGVVEHLVRPNDIGGPAARQNSVIFPLRVPYSAGGNYLLRVDPARRQELLKAGIEALERVNPNRIVLEEQTVTFEELRDRYYQRDRAMAWLLVAVSVALLVVTALGIVGLASFWVQQRTKQIGIRRALGANRRQILHYFQTENFLLATLGIVLGMLLAYGINGLLMERYELPRLPLLFLPVGALALWLLGQISVLGPALRAAAVPPAVATRTA